MKCTNAEIFHNNPVSPAPALNKAISVNVIHCDLVFVFLRRIENDKGNRGSLKLFRLKTGPKRTTQA